MPIYRNGGDSTIFLDAEKFNNVQGSTSRNNFSQNWNAFKYDAAAQESAGTTWFNPGWASAACTMYWATDAEAAGDVVWNIDHQIMVADSGDNTADAASETLAATPTVGTGDWRDLLSTSMGTLTFGAAGSLSSFVVVRLGNNGSDTYSGEAGLIGLKLDRLS